MTQEELEKMVKRYDLIYERNFMRYQQDGDARHQREYQKAEDIRDACLQAMNAADDHEAVIHAGMAFRDLAKAAERCRNNNYDAKAAKETIDRLIRVAVDAWDYREASIANDSKGSSGI